MIRATGAKLRMLASDAAWEELFAAFEPRGGGEEEECGEGDDITPGCSATVSFPQITQRLVEARERGQTGERKQTV